MTAGDGAKLEEKLTEYFGVFKSEHLEAQSKRTSRTQASRICSIGDASLGELDVSAVENFHYIGECFPQCFRSDWESRLFGAPDLHTRFNRPQIIALH